jgi:cytidylate kinase
MSDMSNLISQMADQSCRRWQMQRAAAAARRDLPTRVSHAFSVAISREAGTMGSAVAVEVGKVLNWHVYDRELLEKIADEMGLRASLLESVDERQQNWFRESVQAQLASFMSGGAAPWASESKFVHRLVETVLALGVHGECVIVGRGAAFILPAETTLRVSLVAPVRDRIAVLSRQMSISLREAARRVRTIDRERVDFVQDHFMKNPTDASNFDVVLNVSRLSVGECTKLIVESLRCLQADKVVVLTHAHETSQSEKDRSNPMVSARNDW